MDDQATPLLSENQIRVPGSSFRSPAPVGTTVKTTIERGNAYFQPKLYNISITLQEMVRGKDVMERLKAQGVSMEPSNPDFEYILARIKFGYFLRGRGGKHEDYILPEGQFAAISIDGTEYEVPRISQQPQPQLINHNLSPGESHEGWILLQVPKDDTKPLLIFKREHIEGVYGIWGYVWFQLY